MDKLTSDLNAALSDSDSPDHRTYIDMSLIDMENRLVIDLTSPYLSEISNRYDLGLKDIRRSVTNGGTILGKKPVTYLNEDKLALWLEIRAMNKKRVGENKDVSIIFAIERQNLYFFAFSLDGGKTWEDLQGSNMLVNQSEPSSTCARTSYAYNTDRKSGVVGLSRILYALLELHTCKKDTGRKTAAVHIITLHFAEAARFLPIARRVRKALSEGWYETVTLTNEETLLKNEWRTLSNRVRLAKFAGKNLKKECSYEISTVGVFLMEHDVVRGLRRANFLSNIKKYKSSHVLTGAISKKYQWNQKYDLDQKFKVLCSKTCKKLKASGGDEDTWSCLIRALRQRDENIAQSIILHTDINIVEQDLSFSYDDNNKDYKITNQEMLELSYEPLDS
jgi:hypothetical protein